MTPLAAHAIFLTALASCMSQNVVWFTGAVVQWSQQGCFAQIRGMQTLRGLQKACHLVSRMKRAGVADAAPDFFVV